MARSPKKPRRRRLKLSLPKFGRKVPCLKAGDCDCKRGWHHDGCTGCWSNNKHCNKHKSGCHMNCSRW